MRLFILLSYNGRAYSGWQIQSNAVSVQEKLERALSIAFSQPVSVVGAGRTDALVNASRYIAHFDVADRIIEEPEALLCKINAILPKDICVYELYRVKDDAHARFDAVSRTYRYFVHTSKDPFAERSFFCKFRLDVEAMNAGAQFLLGRHDYSSFEKVGGGNLTSVCTVMKALWSREDETHLAFEITADRFLRNMVRAVVGTLLDVGRGRHKPEWVADVLAAKDRGAAGQSVPGEALFLADIRYPYELTTI